MRIDLAKLRAFYTERKALKETDGTSAPIVDWLAGQPATAETTVDAIVAGIEGRMGVNDAPKLRSSVIKALKVLADETACGEFKTGRHGNVSRMKWSVDPRRLRAAALGEVNELEAWDPASSPEPLVELEIRRDSGGGSGVSGGFAQRPRGGGGPAKGGGGRGPLAFPFPNLEVCIEFFSSTKTWPEPVLAAARAGLWDDDVPPPEWQDRLDRLEDAHEGVRPARPSQPGSPGPRPPAVHKRS